MELVASVQVGLIGFCYRILRMQCCLDSPQGFSYDLFCRLAIRCSSVIAVTLLSYPLERIKNITTVVPSEENLSSGLIASLIRFISRRGLSALFVGLVPAIVGNLVHEAS